MIVGSLYLGLIFCQLPAVPTSSARNEDGSSSEAGGGSSSDEENGAENKKGEDMRLIGRLGCCSVLVLTHTPLSWQSVSGAGGWPGVGGHGEASSSLLHTLCQRE